MRIVSIKTEIVKPGTSNLTDLLDKYLSSMPECAVLAVTSKLVSLCENRILPTAGNSREELIKREASLYLPSELSKYGYHFTITKDTLIASAGIDESNGDGNYVLWPEDSQKSANAIRHYLADRFNLTSVGVIVTDSTSMPLRRGSHGVALSHSGFKALKDYVGQPDLFGRPFEVSQANLAEGLAAAAVVVMGEGAEQTPIAVISELPFIDFSINDPSDQELKQIHITKSEDLFAPFLENVDWITGQRSD